MAKLHSALVVFFTMILLVTGCAKTVEGESKKWDANVVTVNALGVKYPGLKPALDARIASAKATYDSAAAQDEESKIKTMAAANSALMSGWVTDLNGIEASLGKLRETRVTAASMAGDESSRLAAKLAAEDAGKTVDRVEKTLKGGAKDEATAKALVDKAKTDIESSQKAVDKVLEGDKKKADKATDKAAADKAATDATKAAADKSAADAKAAVADWTCAHCDSKNKSDATSCASCGAPKP